MINSYHLIINNPTMQP